MTEGLDVANVVNTVCMPQWYLRAKTQARNSRRAATLAGGSVGNEPSWRSQVEV